MTVLIVPRSLPVSLYFLIVSLGLFWIILSLYLGLAMPLSLVCFPLVLSLVIGFVFLKSYLRNELDYGFYMIFLFFFIGYFIDTGLTDVERETAIWGTWTSVGRFNFSMNHYLKLWFVVSFGMLGSISGYQIAKRISKKRFKKSLVYSPIVYKNPNLIFLLWFISGILLELLMLKLGIGRHAQTNLTNLPFKFAGAMVYYRDCIHILLLGYILTHLHFKNKIKKGVIFLITFESAIATLSSLSKSAIVFRFVPLLFFVWFNKKIPKRKVIGLLFIGMIGTSIAFSGITLLRTRILTSLSIAELFEKKRDDFANIFLSLNVAFKRSSHSQNVMAVVSHEGLNRTTFIRTVFNSSEEGINNDTVKKFYGIDFGGRALAKGIGLLGLLYTSGSLAVVFIGTFSISCLICFVEKMAYYRSQYMLGIYYATLFFFTFYLRGISRAGYTIVLGFLFIGVVRFFEVSRSCHRVSQTKVVKSKSY